MAGRTIVEQLDWSGQRREVDVPKEKDDMPKGNPRGWDERVNDYSNIRNQGTGECFLGKLHSPAFRPVLGDNIRDEDGYHRTMVPRD